MNTKNCPIWLRPRAPIKRGKITAGIIVNRDETRKVINQETQKAERFIPSIKRYCCILDFFSSILVVLVLLYPFYHLFYLYFFQFVWNNHVSIEVFFRFTGVKFFAFSTMSFFCVIKNQIFNIKCIHNLCNTFRC